MILRIYAFLYVIGIIIGIVYAVFMTEYSYRPSDTLEKICDAIEKILKYYVVLIIIYTFIMLIYSIVYIKSIYFIMQSLSFLLAIVFFILLKKQENFDFLIGLFIIICASIWIVFSFIVFGYGNSDMYTIGDKSIEKKFVKTIEILEFNQTSYTEIHGGRYYSKYYIKSAPSSAYYYEVATNNNGSTTKVIDGAKDYVEKHVDIEYSNNPHIDVYEVIKSYKNLYAVTCKEKIRTEYHIYIPPNSIFFDK